MKITSSKTLSNFCRPFFIAELGSNHNGDMDIAKELIVQAKNAGADCVKFQSWTKDSIFSKKKYSDNYFLADDYRNRSDYTLEQIVERYSISENQLSEMMSFANGVGIDCTSTPFSKREVDFLVEACNVPFIKIASMDLNNYPFLEYVAGKGKPMVLSTGLSELYEIDRAVKTIEAAGNNQIVILHCISNYPPKDSEVNLRNITTLMQCYPSYPIGFSDHTIGSEIPLAATVLGACVIEKHFTLDKNLEGWDHKVSTTPSELKSLIFSCNRVVDALGSTRITARESEEKKREFRRSIVLKNAMPAGSKLKDDDLDVKRPGGGFLPESRSWIVGRTINKDLPDDHILTPGDFI